MGSKYIIELDSGSYLEEWSQKFKSTRDKKKAHRFNDKISTRETMVNLRNKGFFLLFKGYKVIKVTK